MSRPYAANVAADDVHHTNMLHALSPDERRWAEACAALDHGALGPEQPPKVRAVLLELQAQGLAEYGGDEQRNTRRGWRLTLAGRSRKRAFLNAHHDRAKAIRDGGDRW